jgi:hypothetical protein
MSDEHTDKLVKLLEEIRDLTKERNDELKSYTQMMRQRYDEALQRRKEAEARMLSRRRRFLWVLTPLLLMAIGFMAYLGFWVIPRSEERDAQRWIQDMQMIQSNYWSQPR